MSSNEPGLQDDPRRRAAAEARARLRPDGAVSAPAGDESPAPPAAPVPPAADTAGVPEAVPEQAAKPANETVPAPVVGVPPAPVTPPSPPVAPAASESPRPGAPARAGGRARAGVAALGVVCVALAAAFVVALLDIHHDDQSVTKARAAATAATRTARSERSAVSAAKTFALDLASYRYTSLAQDEKRILASATASFRKSYSTSTDALDKILKAYKASATARVVAAGVQSATPTQVVVLLFVDQTATSTRMKHATTEESRLQMTLLRQHDHWLIDKVVLE